jgi:hypothetical protein
MVLVDWLVIGPLHHAGLPSSRYGRIRVLNSAEAGTNFRANATRSSRPISSGSECKVNGPVFQRSESVHVIWGIQGAASGLPSNFPTTVACGESP